MKQYKAVVKKYDVVRFTQYDLETALEQLKKSGAQEIGIQIELVENTIGTAFGAEIYRSPFMDKHDDEEYCIDCGAEEPELCWCDVRCNFCDTHMDDCDC